jgi:hypothetical protein
MHLRAFRYLEAIGAIACLRQQDILARQLYKQAKTNMMAFVN